MRLLQSELRTVKNIQTRLLDRIAVLEHEKAITHPMDNDDAHCDNVFTSPAPYTPPTRCYQATETLVHPARRSKAGRRGTEALDSCFITKQGLITPDEIVASNPKLVKPSKAATFAVKLAREAFFGGDVLRFCTVYGCRDYPGLPVAKLQELKKYLFSRFTVYWNNATEFKTL